MRLTLRGKIVLAAVTVVLGLTAQHWNPYTEAITRQADQGVTEYEDGSRSDGTCRIGADCDDNTPTRPE